MTEVVDNGGTPAADAPPATPAAAPSPAAALLGGDPPAAAPPAAAPADPGKSFLDGLTDVPDDLKAWATNKGFPSIKDALESHHNLEKLLGNEKVPLPKDPKDAEGYDRVYKALGKPDDPAAYKLDQVAGADPAFAGEAGKWFHEVGLNPAQAGKLAEQWNAYQTKAQADQAAAFQAQSAQEVEALRAEWGSKFDANAEIARRAAQQFGLADKLPALEQAMGAKGMLSFLKKIGSSLGEATFEDGEPATGFSMSPEKAQARIASLKGDTEWAKSYAAGDKTKLAEMERLHQIAFPGMTTPSTVAAR